MLRITSMSCRGRQGEGLSLALPLPFHSHLSQGPSVFCSLFCTTHKLPSSHPQPFVCLFSTWSFLGSVGKNKHCLQARCIALKSKRFKKMMWFLMGMHFHMRGSGFLHQSHLWPVIFQGNCLKIKWFLQYSSSNQVRIELINPGSYHPSWKQYTSMARHMNNSENITKLLL